MPKPKHHRCQHCGDARDAAPNPRPCPPPPTSRSAAALALSHEPTFDEGTARRIKEAALSYSDLAVRGGWPTIPSDAKFAAGVAGPNDDLLRKRLIISGDLAAEKASGPFDADLTEAGDALPGAVMVSRRPAS